jgi:hypothetical protein
LHQHPTLQSQKRQELKMETKKETNVTRTGVCVYRNLTTH